MDTGIHGPLDRSEFKKRETGIHEPLIQLEFSNRETGIQGPLNRSGAVKIV